MSVDPGSFRPQRFWDVLKRRGYTFFAGVPDSTFGSAYNMMVKDPNIWYIPAVRVDVALGLASAAYFTGRNGAVIMQNLAIGNIVNPLTSFSLIYKIPVPLIDGWRGYGGLPTTPRNIGSWASTLPRPSTCSTCPMSCWSRRGSNHLSTSQRPRWRSSRCPVH